MTTLRKINDCRSHLGIAAYVFISAFLALSYLLVFELNLPKKEDPRTGLHYMGENFKHYADADQYGRLADALIHGRTTLDLPVPKELSNLEDPYDFNARASIGSESVPIFWDHAFYKGHYYCYFGVVPAVLFFMPYQLVTGNMLYTPYALRFIGLLAVLVICLLIRRACLRYFPQSTTTFSLLILSTLFFFSSNLIYLAFVAEFYSVPMVSSILFTALGFWFFLGAPKEEKGELSILHMAAGSICMAINLGCRPQFIIASFLAIGIFWRELFQDGILLTKNGRRALFAVALSYVAVILPLLLYNYIRFGSFFDFGSNYNLTGFNMVEYEQDERVTRTLLFDYLFQQITFTPKFPFIAVNPTVLPIKTWVPNEPFFGGIFALIPMLWFIALLPCVWKEMKERNLLPLFVICIVASITVLIVDIRTAGITQRYFTDFVFYLAIAASCVLLCLQIRINESPRKADPKMFGAICLTLLLFTATTNAMSLFSKDRYESIATLRPGLYKKVSSIFK